MGNVKTYKFSLAYIERCAYFHIMNPNIKNVPKVLSLPKKAKLVK